MNINHLLYAASFLLFISFVPLIRRMIKTKSSEGVSAWMLIFGLVQSISFITYDLYFQRYSMAIPFVILLFFFGISLVFVWRYK